MKVDIVAMAWSGSALELKVTFRDNNGDLLVPGTITYDVLTAGGTTLYNPTDPVPTPASVIYLTLEGGGSGEPLRILTAEALTQEYYEVTRVLRIQWTYTDNNSSTATRDDCVYFGVRKNPAVATQAA